MEHIYPPAIPLLWTALFMVVLPGLTAVVCSVVAEYRDAKKKK